MGVGTNGGFRPQELVGQKWRAAMGQAATDHAHALNALHAQAASHDAELRDIEQSLKAQAIRADDAFALALTVLNLSFWGRMKWLLVGR